MDRRISKNLKDYLLPFIQSDEFKTNLYDGFMGYIKNAENFKNLVIFNVYTSGDSLAFDYITF